MTELVEGEFAGEQHFTFDAAMRETAKVGKRVPTVQEWRILAKAISPDVNDDEDSSSDRSIRKILNLKFVGWYSPSETRIGSLIGYYWLAPAVLGPSGRRYGFYVLVTPEGISWDIGGDVDIGVALSVRCLRNG